MLVSSVCIMEEVNNFLQVKLMKKENIQVNQKENYGQKEAVTWILKNECLLFYQNSVY